MLSRDAPRLPCLHAGGAVCQAVRRSVACAPRGAGLPAPHAQHAGTASMHLPRQQAVRLPHACHHVLRLAPCCPRCPPACADGTPLLPLPTQLAGKLMAEAHFKNKAVDAAGVLRYATDAGGLWPNAPLPFPSSGTSLLQTGARGGLRGNTARDAISTLHGTPAAVAQPELLCLSMNRQHHRRCSMRAGAAGDRCAAAGDCAGAAGRGRRPQPQVRRSPAARSKEARIGPLSASQPACVAHW